MALQVSDYSRGYRYRYEYERYVEVGESSHSPTENLHLDTLVGAVGLDLSQQFRWMAETGTIQTYEHRVTSRYIHIDSETGQFCDQNRNLTSAAVALAHAMEPPPLTLAYPKEDNPELEIGLFVRRRSWSVFSSGRYNVSETASRVTRANRWRNALSQFLYHAATELQSSRMLEENASSPVRANQSAGLVECEPSDFQLHRFSRRAA